MIYCGKCAASTPDLFLLRGQLVCDSCRDNDVGYWREVATAERLRADACGDDFAALNGHVIETQVLLANHGIQCGADGSIVVGINRLIERIDAAEERLRLANERLDEIEVCTAPWMPDWPPRKVNS